MFAGDGRDFCSSLSGWLRTLRLAMCTSIARCSSSFDWAAFTRPSSYLAQSLRSSPTITFEWRPPEIFCNRHKCVVIESESVKQERHNINTLNHNLSYFRITSMSCIVQARCITMFSHMPDETDAKKILTAFPLGNWRRPAGRPHTMRMNSIQQDLKSNNLSLSEWSNQCGSESSTLETDVYIWHYALLVVHTRNDVDDLHNGQHSLYTTVLTSSSAIADKQREVHASIASPQTQILNAIQVSACRSLRTADNCQTIQTIYYVSQSFQLCCIKLPRIRFVIC